MRLPLPVRLAGARLVGGVPVRIRSGPNRGRLWSLASSGRGYTSGRFEVKRLNWLLSVLRPDDCFWDAGAHKGYVTLAAAARLTTGRAYAIEPSRLNLVFLERHLRWNRAERATVLPFALSDADRIARFGGPGSTLTYRLGRGAEEVRVRSIRSLIEQDGIPAPTVLKVDVEGEECPVLAGSGDHIPDDALLLIAIHTREQYECCRGWLAARGFRAVDSARLHRVAQVRAAAWAPDPDLLGIGPAREISSAALNEFTT